VVVVFQTQRRNVGFEPGHHGWVSSHGLAIARKAVPAAGFLGHSVRVEERGGALELVYFDRYPVFFSALAQRVLARGDPALAAQVFRARQLMNAVFVATLLAVYALVRVLGWDAWIALAGTLFALSGTYALSYKDMFHFDQPALLGSVLLWIGIALYEKEGRRTLLYALAIVAVCLGRGYASGGVVLAWLACQAVATLRAGAADHGVGAAIRALARLEALRVLVLFAAVASLLVAYNVAVERWQTGEPLADNSIVGSATRRLGFSRGFDEQFAPELAWSSVLATQLERLAIGVTPAMWGIWVDPTVNGVRARLDPGGLVFASSIVALGALALGAPWLRRRRGAREGSAPARDSTPLQRRMLAVLALSGPVWLLPLRRLAQFHDYTAIYYLGLFLAVALAILHRSPRKLVPLAAALAFALFVGGNLAVNRRDGLRMLRANAETHEMQRVAAVLPRGARVHVDGGWTGLIPGAPFALGFYLPDATLVEELRRADYVLARRKVAAGGLTPRNRSLFAYETRRRARTRDR
jgi:hypothetical protein